jgi:hypothetical protein
MERREVVSTAVQAVGYDAATRTLVVEFEGGVWAYDGVPPGLFDELVEVAEQRRATGDLQHSVGRLVNTRVKDVFPERKLGRWPALGGSGA